MIHFLELTEYGKVYLNQILNPECLYFDKFSIFLNALCLVSYVRKKKTVEVYVVNIFLPHNDFVDLTCLPSAV